MLDMHAIVVIRLCLGIVIAGCAAYFFVGPSKAELEEEHRGGKHQDGQRHGCPLCPREP